MKRLAFFVFAALALCGCKKDEYPGEDGVFPTPNMIMAYTLIEEITCEKKDNNTMSFNPKGKRVYNYDDLFSYLCNMYNDISFNKEIVPFTYRAFAYPFDKITMSCNADFDDNHKAGASLDDIVKIKFESLWDYINNGYEYPEEYKKYEESASGLSVYGVVPYELYLSEVNSSNSKLITPGYHNHIIFTSSPTTPGEYTFTLELTTNGETFTTTFTHKFE